MLLTSLKPHIHQFYTHKLADGKDHLNALKHVCHKLFSIIFDVFIADPCSNLPQKKPLKILCFCLIANYKKRIREFFSRIVFIEFKKMRSVKSANVALPLIDTGITIRQQRQRYFHSLFFLRQN